jgi:glutathione S-transferase
MPRAELVTRLQAHPDAKRAQTFLDASAGAVNDSAIVEAQQSFVDTLRRIDLALLDRPWLGGASFGLADAAMAPMVERLEHIGMNTLFQSPARLSEWSARILSRASVAGARAPARYRIPFIKGKP